MPTLKVHINRHDKEEHFFNCNCEFKTDQTRTDVSVFFICIVKGQPVNIYIYIFIKVINSPDIEWYF